MYPTSPETIFRLAGVTAAIEVFRARPASPSPAAKPTGTPTPDAACLPRAGHPRLGRRAQAPPLASPPPPARVVAQAPTRQCDPTPTQAQPGPPPAGPAWPDHLACLRLAEQVRAAAGAAGVAWAALCDLLAAGAANGLTLGIAAHTLAWQLPDMTADQRQAALVTLKRALRSAHLFACPWAAFGLLAHGAGAGLEAVEAVAARLTERLADDLDEAAFLAQTLRLEAIRCGVVWRLWVAGRTGEDTHLGPLSRLPGLRGELGLALDRSGRRHAARRGGLPPLAGDLAGAWGREALACVLRLFPAGPAGGDASAAAGPWPEGSPPAAPALRGEAQALWRAAEASRDAHHGLLPLLPALDEPRRSFAEALARQACAAARHGAPSLREAAGVGALAQRVADRLCPRLAARPQRGRRDLV